MASFKNRQAGLTLPVLLCMQDTAWLDVYLSDIPHVIYQVGSVHADDVTTAEGLDSA